MSKTKNSTKKADSKKATKKADSKKAVKNISNDVLNLSHKNQLSALKKAQTVERSQFGMFNRLKQLDRDFAEFSLNPFQQAICENINIYFIPFTTIYSKGMKRKAKQVQRLKNRENALVSHGEGKLTDKELKALLSDNEPLMNETFVLTYENNGIEFTKSYNTQKKANEAKKALSVKNVVIDKRESLVKTGFSENEAIRLLHKAEKLFLSAFPSAEVITLPMIKRAFGLDVPKKEQEKKAVEATKISFKKAS